MDGGFTDFAGGWRESMHSLNDGNADRAIRHRFSGPRVVAYLSLFAPHIVAYIGIYSGIGKSIPL